MATSPYDAFLLLSFGGPERPEDVMPFLENVTRGRGVPRERLEAVAGHYHHFGGKSPINDQNRALLDAIRADFAANGVHLPLYFGNRNWHPFLADTLRRMRDEGVRHAIGFVTSAYGSWSGCRQYMEDVARARAEVGDGAPAVDLIRKYGDHPGFVEASTERLRDAIERLPDEHRASARVVFTAHSIPVSMARSSPYEAQIRETARLVAARAGGRSWDLVYQSRSGPPSVPWLEPDVLDHLRALRAAGETAVVLAPVGFVSDHMEVVYDLDHEARLLAAELGLVFERAGTAGTHPRFVAAVRELVLERTRGGPRLSLSADGPAPDVCPETCCPAPARPGR